MEEKIRYWKAEGFTSDQITELKNGIEADLDVSSYENKEFLAIQMREIRLGLEEGIDVSWYAKPNFDWFQMEEIRKGLTSKLDVSIYAFPNLSYDRMQQIRKGLKIGLDLSPYRVLDAGILREIRYSYINHVNIMPYIKDGYDKEQLEAIRIALEKEINIEPFIKKEIRGICLHEICIGLEEGLDVSVYANEHYFWQQMREIRLGLEEGLDVSYYQSLRFSASDMEKRRLLLKNHEEPQVGVAEVILPEPVEGDNFSVYVTPDEMAAIIEIKTAAKKLTRGAILKALCNAGVSSGIDYDEIDRIVRGKDIDQPIQIAKGEQIKDGEDGWYEFFFRKEIARKPKILEDGNVDYRDVEWCETVEEGQKIAVYHIAKQGTHGRTVTGKRLISKRGKEKQILTGTGIKRLPDGRTYVATTSGVITLNEFRIDITKMLTVDEVSPATGDIHFNGSVLVHGDVRLGAKITVTEDLIVDGFVEGAKITCGGSAAFRKGMNGSGSGYVHAGGDVIGYFFENTEIDAKGDIQGDYFFNCTIHTSKSLLVMGRKGMLAGGTAYAEEGITTYNLGNVAGLHTVVKAGIGDRLNSQELTLNRKLREVMHDRLIFEDAHKSLQKKYPPEIRNTMELYLKIESAIYTKEKEMEQILLEKSELDTERKKAANISIKVQNQLFDNVLVDIDGIKWMSINVRSVMLYKSGEKIVATACD